MKTKQLMQFTAVAHARSVSEAAQRLNIAQPALSHAISTLEDDIGAKLFVRHRRGVELTDSGTILLEHAEAILNQIQTAREAVREIEANPSGSVNIAFPASVAHVIIQPFLKIMFRDYPQINLVIEEGLTGNLIRWLRSGRIDVMVDFDAYDSGEFAFEPLVEEDLFLFGVEIGGQSDIPFKELINYPLFLPGSAHSMEQAFSRYENSINITMNKIPVRVSVHPMIQLVKAKLGYSISAWSLIYDLIGKDGLDARRIIDPDMTRTAYLLHSRTRTPTVATRAVCSAIREAVRYVHAQGIWKGDLLLANDME